MNKNQNALTFYIYGKKFCPRRVLSATKNYNYFIENGLQPVDDPKDAFNYYPFLRWIQFR